MDEDIYTENQTVDLRKIRVLQEILCQKMGAQGKPEAEMLYFIGVCLLSIAEDMREISYNIEEIRYKTGNMTLP